MRACIALLAVLLVLLAAACSRPDGKKMPTSEAPGSPPGAPTATAEPTPTEQTLLGLPVRPLKLGEPVPLPKDVALYIESGCWGCDGPAAALQRVYRAPDGEIRIEDLFRIPGATAETPEVNGKYITSMAMEGGGDDILLAVCESPYCGGVGEIADGAKVSIHHSADGGITWVKELTVDGGAWVIASRSGLPVRGGFGILYRIYRPAPGAAYRREFAWYPSLATEPIDLQGQDPNSAKILEPASGPTLLGGVDGITLYRLEGGSANPHQLDFSALPPGAAIEDLQFLPGVQVLATWTGPNGAMYSAIVTTAPESPVTYRELFRWPADRAPSFHRPQGGFVDARTWVIAVPSPSGRGNVPAIVNFDTATIHPIAELLNRAMDDANTGYGADRALVNAVSVGPFARVRGTGKGDCLQVRESPALSAPAFACYADDVLLKERGERADADGHTWALVFTPQQRQGWASTQFLETSGAAPSLAGHPKGTRTGNSEVGPVIGALERSATVPDALIGWHPVKCEAPPVPGIGGPPPCPEGIADGTPLDVISGAACEGYFRVRPPDGSGVKFVAGPEDRLYAVVRRTPGATYPSGAAYMLIYVSEDRPEFGKAIFVTGGRIAGDWSGCGASPAEMLKMGGSVVLPPPQ